MQTYQNLELILIDGYSKDKSLDILKDYSEKIKIKILKSKIPGVFPSINLGLQNVSGDIIFILHADNFLDNEKVFENIVREFSVLKLDILFTSISMIEKSTNKNIRNYKADNFKNWMIRIGHMPPHSGFFMKKEIINQIGYYDEKFKVASDFDYIVRIINSKKKFNIKYSNQVSAKVLVGGISNTGFKSVIFNTLEQKKILNKNKIYSNFLILLFRIPLKILQFFN